MGDKRGGIFERLSPTAWAPAFTVARAAVVLAAALASACVTAPAPESTAPEPEPVEVAPDPWRYEPAPALTEEAIATLRATPPPVAPELVDGTNPAADDQALRAQGFMRVGSGHFAADDPAIEEHVRELGIRVVADQAMLYPPARGAPADAAAATGTGELAAQSAADERVAAYYVRFNPPFGAGFRDLNDVERRAAGARGGVSIVSVIGASPAADANLREGDLVLALDGTAIPDAVVFKQMLRERAGTTVTLTLLRGVERVRRIVRLGALPAVHDP